MAVSLTATGQNQYARVLLQLTFTTVTEASIFRVHADGSEWPVRNADPITVTATSGVGAIVYDHEAPLDVAVTYKATSTGDATVPTTSSVILASGGKAWLTHPLKPSLGGAFTARDLDDITYDGRGAELPILGSRYPVGITDVEVAGASTVVLQTATTAQASTLRALTADGAVLMLRLPATWDVEPWLYARRRGVIQQRYINIAARSERRWAIPYQQVATPAGVSQGAVGATWTDLVAAYADWTAVIAGEPTWRDPQIKAGP
jgi:hypothetical protein